MKERDFPTSASNGMLEKTEHKVTAVDQVADILIRVSALTYELRLLADRLVGPQPEDEVVVDSVIPSGVIPNLHYRAKEADKHISMAFHDINRICQLI